jgi:hypothetical protein
MPRQLHGSVAFAVPAEPAFDYLVDPRNRPEWQLSLRRVDDVAGEPGVGQTWTDVTRPGLRPAMRTGVFDRPRLWSESGTWRFVRADLTLRFDPVGDGACEVRFAFRIHALGPIGLAASAVSVPAVRSDLERAARILSSRT